MGDENESIGKGLLSSVASTRALDFKLGFALVLLKSKPPAVSLRDHVSRLRQHIKQGVNLAAYEDRHLDGLQFWKEQYDTLKSSEMELREKTYALEKQNESLTEQIRALSANNEHPRKRQRSSDAGGTNHTSSSRQSKSIARAHSILGIVDNFKTVFSALDPVANAVPLMLHVRCLHRLMKSSDPDIPGLSTTLICALSSMAGVLSSVCTRVQGRNGLAAASDKRQSREGNRVESLAQGMEDQQIGDVFRGIFKIFKYLLKGLDAVTSSGESSSQGNVYYNFVRLFADGIDCLSARSVVRGTTNRSHSASALMNPKGWRDVSDKSSPVTLRVEEIRMRLSQLLINMIVSLDPTRKDHAELYEGFQFVLLTRLGQRLSFFVFGEESTSSTLDGLGKGGLKGKNHSAGEDTRARQEEAWYLIWLLERVMVDLHDNNPACKLLARTSDASKESGSQSLLGKAKARMRSTLLRGVFGDDAEDFDGLEMPPFSSGSCSGLADTPREGMNVRLCSPEFFVQEAWRLIGWQILAGEDLL